jgi:CPA1 family monovalent cation:H+ antiporter
MALLETTIVLLVAVLGLTAVARTLLVPYPILLVLGGLVVSFIPGLPAVRLNPDLVFLVFLPPILWAAAYFTSWRDFRASLRPIVFLAVGLVAVTTLVVAYVATALIPGLPWAAAVALGAIVSPPDAVAATAIARRLAIPHPVVTVLEGESLVNDAGALVLYRVAVAVAMGGLFHPARAVADFVVTAAGGVLVGLAVAWLCQRWLARTTDSFIETALTLVAPYVAWIVAERLHTSAVLACVGGGLYLRRGFSALVAPATRVQARAVWELVVFLLNGVIFILIGLQLGPLRAALGPGRLGPLAADAAVISLAVIAVRLVWVPVGTALLWLLAPRLRARDPMPSPATVFLVSWTAMRGIVSLAAALALPEGFPLREEVILVTFGVILVTLVLQGLTLAPLIRWLALPPDSTLEREEQLARQEAVAAAIATLDALATEPWAQPDQVDRIRTWYGGALRRSSSLGPAADDATRTAAATYRRLRHATIEAERNRVIRLRNQDAIGDDVLERLERELDIEELRLGTGEYPHD